MGSWSGHTLPGSFFIFFGIIWAIKASYRFFFPFVRHTGAETRCRCRVRCDVLEGAAMIFAAGFGLLIEQLLPWEPWFHLTESGSNEFTRANNWSHSTMYAFFLAFGITQILVIKMPIAMPHCLHHISLALAFGVEGYLFYFHTHGREELDVRVHVLLLFAIWPTSLLLLILSVFDSNDNLANGYAIKAATTAHKTSQNGTDSTSLLQGDDDAVNEGSSVVCNSSNTENIPLHEGHSNAWGENNGMTSNYRGASKFKSQVLIRKKILTLQLCTATLTILHGTWFWQAAYVLYPPSGTPWEQDNHKNVSFLTMFFTWHLLLAMILVGVVFLVFGIAKRLKWRRWRDSQCRYYLSPQNDELL